METAVFRMIEPFALPEALGHEQDVDSVIRRAVAGKQPIDRRLDQRRDVRYAYPYPLTLLPLDVALRGEQNRMIAAIGKHVTVHGVDFYTSAPIAAKEVICQFHSPTCAYSLVLELTWCRHNAQGWFENGGKFLRVWKTPATLRA
jgi:hypothetical protein